ncbi:hypothetical protein CEXT_609231 [Caerostris extrusa]|uniref:Uncharacterized protein n=1 Tax=Caerostris extrusa TaxID=172846 RepID=A0AAV4P2Z0_CAEEX|nr:hypothetical protein CEXT_609231 [Caerostris extrusa]
MWACRPVPSYSHFEEPDPTASVGSKKCLLSKDSCNDPPIALMVPYVAVEMAISLWCKQSDVGAVSIVDDKKIKRRINPPISYVGH